MGKPLVLFGAGASYGSDAQDTPPLGPDLFDALARFSPETWGRIPQGEAAAFKRDFEQGMTLYAHSHPAEVDVLQRAMAAFFFRFRPEESNLYVKLARWMQRVHWNGALASLNYERLLELALDRVGLKVALDAGHENAMELCLPHGCCHLFGQIKASENIVLDKAIRIDSPGIRAIKDPRAYRQELVGSAVPPVMSYFEPDKDTRAGVSFIKQQRQRFARLATSASVVAIVGLKVRPHDDHIWGPLRQSGAQLVYCAPKDAALEFGCWARSHGRMAHHVIPALWANAFEDICEALSA
jgi:hypothetical protein